MSKNYGLDLDKEKQDQSEKDWEFKLGAELHCLSKGIDLNKYLPEGEVQRTPTGDMMDCATREPINDIETKLTALVKEMIFHPSTIKWLHDNGYMNERGNIVVSDAFIAIKSGTTKSGNSLKAPWEAVRTCGVIPKAMMPLEQWMTWDDYHDPARITQTMIDLGLEFKKRITVNYERVYERDFKNLLDNTLLGLAGYAWSKPVNGIYPRVEYDFNHAFMGIKGTYLPIFDNYLDRGIAGDFIKQLAPNYKLMGYGYRSILTENILVPESKKKMNIEVLRILYKLIFYRDMDELAKGHLDHELMAVLSAMAISPEWQRNNRVIGLLRSLGILKFFGKGK